MTTRYIYNRKYDTLKMRKGQIDRFDCSSAKDLLDFYCDITLSF